LPGTFATWRSGPGGGIPNGSLALDDQRRHLHRVELVQPALLPLARAARRLEWECEAEHRDGAGRLHRAASDAGAQRATADNERQAD
jgi:hypothetical protein